MKETVFRFYREHLAPKNKEVYMSESNQFDWVDFYKELAGILLQYKSNRRELIEKVKRIYEITGINLPKLEKATRL